MRNKKGEEVGIIYGWYCTVTDKWYIGQTVNPEKRFNCHIDRAINKKDKTYFYNSIRKYGLENFVYCVLEENVLRENLNIREMDWIEYYDSFYDGYNMSAGGGQTIFSEEFKEKISEANKGRIPWNKGKHGIYSEETRKKLSESHKGKSSWNKGIPMNEEAKKKLSESHKQLICEKNPFYGRHHTEESKRKMSESHKGKRMSEETRKRISESLKGIVSPNRKMVYQYDLCGNFIKEYACIADAIKENPKCGAISLVCNGYRKQAGGFIWKYA